MDRMLFENKYVFFFVWPMYEESIIITERYLHIEICTIGICIRKKLNKNNPALFSIIFQHPLREHI